jgi:hypothetical protein
VTGAVAPAPAALHAGAQVFREGSASRATFSLPVSRAAIMIGINIRTRTMVTTAFTSGS